MSWPVIKSRHLLFILAGLILIGLISLFFWRIIDEEEWLYLPPLKIETQEIVLPPAQELIEKEPLTLIFGGDVMLSRTVNAKMEKYNNYAWPFERIASTTALADITVFNLESPFLKDSDYQVLSGSFSFKANPKSIAGLILSGADVLSLANNHMLNMGQAGISDTLNILRSNDIFSVGAGENETEAREGVLVERNGWKVAFLSYAYPDDASVANANRPGIATMDKDNLKADIARWNEQADLVIVLMHAGVEYVSQPGEDQQAFARAAIEAGADAVIGHHPHWPQSWELYQDKLILYSLGNLVFDQMWSQETSQGLLARLEFKADLSGQAELIPIVIKDYGQAQILPEEQAAESFWNDYNLPVPGILSWPAPARN